MEKSKLIELLDTMNDQANELISLGNSKEKAEGKGMQIVIESILSELFYSKTK